VTKPHNEAKRVTREATLTWVPIGLMRVPQFAQRKFRPAWANKLESELDLEKLGTPTVNKRGGLYYMIDGQHRVEAYKKWIGEGWENQQLHCWTYHDLSEQQMAETFLVLNHRLNVNTFEAFPDRCQREPTRGDDHPGARRARGLERLAERSRGRNRCRRNAPQGVPPRRWPGPSAGARNHP
jgi:hypothetical protein